MRCLAAGSASADRKNPRLYSGLKARPQDLFLPRSEIRRTAHGKTTFSGKSLVSLRFSGVEMQSAMLRLIEPLIVEFGVERLSWVDEIDERWSCCLNSCAFVSAPRVPMNLFVDPSVDESSPIARACATVAIVFEYSPKSPYRRPSIVRVREFPWISFKADIYETPVRMGAAIVSSRRLPL